MLRQFTCIMCPMGCSLEAEVFSEDGEKVTGNNCKRGKRIRCPRGDKSCEKILPPLFWLRMESCLASVRLNAPIPKKGYFSVMAEIRKIKVTAPVSIGQIVLQDVLGTGSDDVIIYKNAKRKAEEL